MNLVERLQIKRAALSRSHKRVTNIDRLIYRATAKELKKEIRAKALWPSNQKPDLFQRPNA